VTGDPLRDAIARDCPHRLVDHDTHLGGRQPTYAARVLWWTEHHISRDAAIEQQLDELHRRAADIDSRQAARSYLDEASRIRHQIKRQVIKELAATDPTTT
jgi:hypothetical protein